MVGIGPDQLSPIVMAAKRVAIDYRRLTGRPLGITGEIAEYEAARLLGLRLADARQSGYDAVGGDGTRFQIKARCVGRDAKRRSQQIGAIKRDRDWDAVLLVLLDEHFEPVSVYEADRPAVEAALAAPGSRARNERGALSVSRFKAIGRRVWDRSAGAERSGAGIEGSEATAPGSPVLRMSDLPELFESLPRLSEGDAADFAADLDEIRGEMNRWPAEDRWAH